jgi:hypothetical protein
MTMDDIAAYRPTDELLDEEWSGRTAVLERVLCADARPAAGDVLAVRRGRRRWIGAAAVASAAAVALVLGLVLPSGTPGAAPNAAAATLEKLAVRAAASPADLVRPGQFRHLRDKEVQTGDQPHTTVIEDWTSYDGTVWSKRIGFPFAGQTAYLQFLAADRGSDFSSPSPKFLAGLPTDVGGLRDYLRSHVSGSSSRDEAVFVAVGDMLRGGMASPELRAAAIRVLERTPHITAASGADSLGRPALVITFYDRKARANETQALLFDPNTSVLLEEQQRATDGGSFGFTSTYTEASTVDAVPAAVIANAEVQTD